MWACCDDASSDDEVHNTSNASLLLCEDALIASVLLGGLTDLDELKVSLGYRFALDVFTIIKKGHPIADQERAIDDPELAVWGSSYRPQLSARVDVHRPPLGHPADRVFCEDTRLA